MNFYAMTDEQVLSMPAFRFWSLERQIDRIKSEQELRLINVHSSVTSRDEMKAAVKRLTLELGEKCKVEHALIVAPEPGAKAKFMSLMK